VTTKISDGVPSDILLDQAFTRITGAQATSGNKIELLRNAQENYPAWLKAIAEARSSIHFESYIIHDDDAGRQFADAMKAKAAEGVKVRVLYDWWGDVGATRRRFWRDLKEAGVEVRCFNPPRFDSPFGWVSRDHRKSIVVDGRIAFVSGMCVGRDWVGDPSKGIEPWRDTGISLEGPAVTDVDRAFATTWALTGAPLPAADVARRHNVRADKEGAVARVVATQPSAGGLFRLDQVIAAAAQRSLWLTDAYFVAVTSYVQALCAAASDGIDVRLLVPMGSDVPGFRALSRSGYRPLLAAGVKVFEWDGPMLHAKTAVADGRWARVGSTNLNLTSWLGNWELDVAVEDEAFARKMEAMYEEDLEHATEIVLSPRRRVQTVSPKEGRSRPARQGSRRSAAAGAFGVGSTIGAAMTNHRLLGPAEARLLGAVGTLLLVVAGLIGWWPKVAGVPFAFVAAWLALSLFWKAWKLHRIGRVETKRARRAAAKARILSERTKT
jgi:cardiolipin synthase